MKLPRDCGAVELVRALRRFGYAVDRQEGSHIRMEKSLPSGLHRLTIPNHDPLKVGTLSGILKDVAARHGLSVEQLLAELGL